MFRIGGSANDGIMSMAAPRKNYENGSEYRQKVNELLLMVLVEVKQID